MAWKTPKILEVQVGMEVNMYASAACNQLRQYLLGRGASFGLHLEALESELLPRLLLVGFGLAVERGRR